AILDYEIGADADKRGVEIKLVENMPIGMVGVEVHKYNIVSSDLIAHLRPDQAIGRRTDDLGNIRIGEWLWCVDVDSDHSAPGHVPPEECRTPLVRTCLDHESRPHFPCNLLIDDEIEWVLPDKASLPSQCLVATLGERVRVKIRPCCGRRLPPTSP